MAQHDYSIANQSGAAFRADLNNALLAVVSQNSGAAQPSTTFAYQWWADTTTGLLKIRNAANSGWITVGEFASNLGLLSKGGGTMTGALLADAGGTAALPAIAFSGDPDTGVFRTGANAIGISTGGTEVCRLDLLSSNAASGRRILFENSAEITTAAGSIYISSASSTFITTTITDTTASAASAAVNASTGRIQRSTSSIKYKTQVENADLTYSESLIYGSRPVWYRSLCESDPDEYSYWGFIAEEVAEIDPRMVHWGDDGPEGVQYDRYVVHLVSVIQKQQQRLDALETRIAALEG